MISTSRPSVVFIHSPVYDQQFRWFWHQIDGKYPDDGTVRARAAAIRETWSKYEQMMARIPQCLGLDWQVHDFIVCYLVGRSRPFSDPLTVPALENPVGTMEHLLHELIHQLFIQNNEELAKYWRWVAERYASESRSTQNHILLHAVQSILHPEFFGEEAFLAKREFDRGSSDYNRAWEVVEALGADATIRLHQEVIHG